MGHAPSSDGIPYIDLPTFFFFHRIFDGLCKVKKKDLAEISYETRMPSSCCTATECLFFVVVRDKIYQQKL